MENKLTHLETDFIKLMQVKLLINMKFKTNINLLWYQKIKIKL